MRRLLHPRCVVAIVCVSLMANVALAGNKYKTRQALQQRQTYQAVQVPQQFVIGSPGGNTARQVIIDNGNQTLAYFSHRLGARFLIQQIQVGGYSPVLAARIVSEPVYGSPLKRLGLGMGDVITRLDGVPVTHTGGLDRHILDTKVRYVKAGFRTVSEGWVFIQRHRYFQDTHYPPPGWTCDNSGGLRP